MRRRLIQLARECRGVALIEFAIVLPLTLALALGTFEATRAVRAKMKMSIAAQTIADLIAAQDSVTATDLTNYCNGAKLVMAPFPSASLKAALASVTNDSLDWHDESCGSATAIASPTAIATTLSSGGGNSVIIVQTTYSYTSPIPYMMAASITMKQTAYARPRNVSNVPLN
jgi:Flp pilus assembly protein TadG